MQLPGGRADMTQEDVREVPVLVVGAGPAGLVAAGTLARLGVPVLVAERRRELSGLPRATVISTRSMELLRSWGLEEEILRRRRRRRARAVGVRDAGDGGDGLGRAGRPAQPRAKRPSSARPRPPSCHRTIWSRSCCATSGRWPRAGCCSARSWCASTTGPTGSAPSCATATGRHNGRARPLRHRRRRRAQHACAPRSASPCAGPSTWPNGSPCSSARRCGSCSETPGMCSTR